MIHTHTHMKRDRIIELDISVGSEECWHKRTKENVQEGKKVVLKELVKGIEIIEGLFLLLITQVEWLRQMEDKVFRGQGI